jgi:hypothetical protein
MEWVAEYRRRAEETERFAECVLWKEQRRLILEVARIWRRWQISAKRNSNQASGLPL